MERTCKEQVREHYLSRMNDLRRLWVAYQSGEDEGLEDIGTLNEYGLCLDYVAPGTFNGQSRGYVRYQLSWGGPADEFRFYLDEMLRPVKIEYWFLDWNDGAKITPQGHNGDLLMDLFEDWRETETIDAIIKKATEDEHERNKQTNQTHAGAVGDGYHGKY